MSLRYKAISRSRKNTTSGEFYANLSLTVVSLIGLIFPVYKYNFGFEVPIQIPYHLYFILFIVTFFSKFSYSKNISMANNSEFFMYQLFVILFLIAFFWQSLSKRYRWLNILFILPYPIAGYFLSSNSIETTNLTIICISSLLYSASIAASIDISKRFNYQVFPLLFTNFIFIDYLIKFFIDLIFDKTVNTEPFNSDFRLDIFYNLLYILF